MYTSTLTSNHCYSHYQYGLILFINEIIVIVLLLYIRVILLTVIGTYNNYCCHSDYQVDLFSYNDDAFNQS